MEISLLNSFVQATMAVLETGAGLQARPGELCLSPAADIQGESRLMLICAASHVRGVVLYAMSEPTATALVSRVRHPSAARSQAGAQGGIGELGAMIAQRARRYLVGAGLAVKVSPPVVLIGPGPSLPRRGFQHCWISLHTDCGQIQIHLALRSVPGVQHDEEEADFAALMPEPGLSAKCVPAALAWAGQ